MTALDELKRLKELRALKAAQTATIAEKVEATEAEKEADPWYEDFGEGLAVSGMDTYYGVKDLFTDLTDEERATLADWKADAGESGWGTAGRVVGEIGQMAVPMGGALKGAKALNLASKAAKGGKWGLRALKAAPIATEAAIAAGHGALQLPEAGETRMGNAAWSGVGAGVGGTAARGLSKAVRGIDLKPAAKKIIEAGGYLTPAQAATGATSRGINTVMSVTPILAKATKRLTDKGTKYWGRHAVKDLGDKLGVKTIGFDDISMRNLEKGVTSGYDNAWKAAGEIPDTTFKRINKYITGTVDDFNKDKSSVLKGIAKEVDRVRKNPTTEAKRQLDMLIKDSEVADNRIFNNALKDIRDIYREGLSSKAKNQLKYMDDLYPEYKTAMRAAQDKAGADLVDPSTLLKAAKAEGSKGFKAATGRAPLQEEALMGKATVGQEMPNVLLDTLKGLSQNVPPFGADKLLYGTGQAFTGQTALQKYLQQKTLPIAREYAKALRSGGVTPATVGAAIED